MDLSGSAGHLAVVGAPRTGKSMLLCTLVAALAATHPPDEVQVYAVDLGGGLLHRLSDLAHVGAVVGPREAERAHRLVRELRSLVFERERRFRDLGIDSMASWRELRRAGLDLGGYGEVLLLVDGWGGFVRQFPELEAEVAELAASGMHYGVHVVLAANRWAELRPGLRENLGGRLELYLNDPLDSELGRSAAAALPRLPGRGLTQDALQFQAALPGPPQAVLDRAMTSQSGAVAPPLRVLPTLVGSRPWTSRTEAPAPERPRDSRSPSRSIVSTWSTWTCSGERRICSFSGTGSAARPACSGSSPGSWPPVMPPRRSPCWSSTRAAGCSTSPGCRTLSATPVPRRRSPRSPSTFTAC